MRVSPNFHSTDPSFFLIFVLVVIVAAILLGIGEDRRGGK